MTKAVLKTVENDFDVKDFLNALTDETQRSDSFKLLEWMAGITKETPKMWGSFIIGFGNKHLKYESGRELEWFKIGFSPRKGVISIYLPLTTEGFVKYGEMKNLGKYKIGKGCLYIKKLSDVDEHELKSLIKSTLRDNK